MNAARTGGKLSKNHRLVYEIVQEQGVGRHLAMSDFFGLARVRQPNIGFTTVYRALTRLRDLGLVSEIALPGADSAYYEPSGTPHAHFRCSNCGSVTDVAFNVSSDEIARLAKQLGGEVSTAVVTLQGRCARCIGATP
jgi:Fe2+ or Zn2+ uptake regulation protein